MRRSRFMAAGVSFWWLAALIVLIGSLAGAVSVAWAPPVGVALPVLAGGLLLRRRLLLVLIGVAFVVMASDVAALGWHTTRPGAVVVAVGCAVFAYRLSGSREHLGVQGLRGESMLVELRDRLRAQGELPALPPGWECEALLRSAGTTSFGGDFLVAALTDGGASLEMALVDVSGKGVDAGTRALLLSGALGGLLGSVPPERFLPAANDYLLRNGSGEGFATAVHLVVELATGSYIVESAGHPPAAQFVSGSGTWRLLDSEGPLLGVVPDAAFTPAKGVLGAGDAMLLYTDGLVENAERELTVGIDKLIGEAERLITKGFRDGVGRLIDTVAPDASDDRALVMLWRS